MKTKFIPKLPPDYPISKFGYMEKNLLLGKCDALTYYK